MLFFPLEMVGEMRLAGVCEAREDGHEVFAKRTFIFKMDISHFQCPCATVKFKMLVLKFSCKFQRFFVQIWMVGLLDNEFLRNVCLHEISEFMTHRGVSRGTTNKHPDWLQPVTLKNNNIQTS